MVWAWEWNIIISWATLVLVWMCRVWSLGGWIVGHCQLEFVEFLFVSCEWSWLDGDDTPCQGYGEIAKDFVGEGFS